MRIHLDEAGRGRGEVTTVLDAREASFIKLSVEAARRRVTLVPDIGDHHNDEPRDLGPEAGFDDGGEYAAERDALLRPVLEAEPDSDGQIEATWTRMGVFDVLSAVRNAAQLIHDKRQSPIPEVPSPALGTLLAVLEAPDEAAADELIDRYRNRPPFAPEPLQSGVEASPGTRVVLGFEAASLAMGHEVDFAQAQAIVVQYNEAAAAAVAA